VEVVQPIVSTNVIDYYLCNFYLFYTLDIINLEIMIYVTIDCVISSTYSKAFPLTSVFMIRFYLLKSTI